MKLRGNDVILWKEEMQRKIGTPSRAPHLSTVGKYTCFGCDRVFYYRVGDPDSPQYAKLTKKQKKEKHHKYDYAPFCHKDWHKYGCVGTIRGTQCWLCQLRDAREAGADGNIRHQKTIVEESEDNRETSTTFEPTTVEWKQSGVRRSVGLSSRRGNSKNKKDGKPGRRRSS